MSTKEEKFDLEKAFAELEKLTLDLQSEKLGLEKSLEKFEQGLTLAEKIKKRLKQIEIKVETVRTKFISKNED